MNDEHEIDELEQRLLHARANVDEPALPQGWREGVMRDVRAHAEHSRPAQSEPIAEIERVFRRAGVAAALVALVTGGAVLLSGGSTEFYVFANAEPSALLELMWVLQ